MENTSSKRESKTEKAGLVMSVARIERKLRKGRYAQRITTTSAVFMASTVEYLCSELLELAGNAAHQNKRVRIAPRHIMMAIENDAELKELLKNVQIPEAGVMPFIHQALLKTVSGRGARSTLDQATEEF